ncbi:TIR domain-containing protein, partial [Zoogloea sp.]|uniref:KGGVGR-motif variant AAA ATPase n=1 Tax=Zoogloea sp. TaxID=49181 RepID=UPI00260AE06B
MTSFFTFYSFKGGVGRSMALANVADILARRGLRVLAIDFDLEAPGLERYFQVERSAALASRGLIDLLQSFKKSLAGTAPLDESAEFRQLEQFIFPIYQRPLPNGGELHLLTAGQREPVAQYRQYALAVRTFDWQDFYDNWEGRAFFEWLRSQLAQPQPPRQPYDVVLVDSRTGVTEMGGVCTYLLADGIVMLCAANHQNVEGTREVARDFRSDTVTRLRDGRPLDLVVVPARIEQRDDALLDKFFKRFDSFFLDEEPAAFNEAGLSFRDLTLPYQPEFAFEEIVVSDPERREGRRRIGGAFELLADALTLLARPDTSLARGQQEALQAIRNALAESPDNAPRAVAETRFDPTLRFAGYDVFLSAGEADQPVARALSAELEQAGFSVFLDPSPLTPGIQIAEATTLALHHSRNLLVCAGGRGVSIWQKREIELARSSNQPIRILPILLPGAEEDIFSLSLRGVADMQVEDLRHWPDDTAALAHLVNSLHSKAVWATEADTSATPAANPYVALDAYDEGRVNLIELPPDLAATLAGHLRQSGLCLFNGATGVGKGSLVAALVALLREEGLQPGLSLSVRRLRGDDLAGLAALPAAVPGELLIIEDWDHIPGALQLPVEAGQPLWPDTLLSRLAEARPESPVLLTGHDLPLLAWRQGGSPHAALWARLAPVSCVLAPPDGTTVRRAIETPAVRSGFAFEPGLLDRITQDAGTGPGALPAAQMVLARLWPQAVRGFLTNAAYDACGGVARVFGQHLEIRLALLDPHLRLPVEAILLRLAIARDDHQTGWQSVAWETLRTQPALAERGPAALLWLIRERLVNACRLNPGHLDISLLLPILPNAGSPLQDLVDAHRDVLRERRRLDAGITAWEVRGRTPDALPAGYRLDEALRLQAEWAPHLNETEREFITLGSKRASSRRQRVLYVVGGLLTLAVTGWLTSLMKVQEKEISDENLRSTRKELQELEAAATLVQQKLAPTAPSGMNLAQFAGTRIYPHYRAATDREAMAAISLLLRGMGVRLEPAELKTGIPTCGEVRFFHPDDATRAEALSELVARQLRTLDYDFRPSLIDLSQSRMARNAPGQLELWLPPLTSLAPLESLPSLNPSDDAELRPVPGSCSIQGSTPEERQAQARQLGVPYIKLYESEEARQLRWVDGFLRYRFEVT